MEKKLDFGEMCSAMDISIKIPRTDEFRETAKRLSDFIESLLLPTEDNHRLIELMVEMTNAAERSGFAAGIRSEFKVIHKS